MPDILQELKERKRKIKDLQQQKARQEGQKEEVLRRLKEEFNVSSIKETEEKLEIFGKELIQNGTLLKDYKEQMDSIIVGAHQKITTRTPEE